MINNQTPPKCLKYQTSIDHWDLTNLGRHLIPVSISVTRHCFKYLVRRFSITATNRTRKNT